MKYLLDTNVYAEGCLSEENRSRFRKTFFPLLPATFFSAVVAYELAVNAENGRTRSLLQEFIGPMQRSGRIVNPNFEDWVEAAEVVTAIKKKDHSWKSKLPALLNDILIALSARRIGATLLTHNEKDFRLIRRYKVFSLTILKG